MDRAQCYLPRSRTEPWEVPTMSDRTTCDVDGCERPRRGRGEWCRMHYEKLRPRPACSVPGCARRSKGRDLCAMHYSRWQRHGSASAGDVVPPLLCKHPGCDRRHYGLSYCHLHYRRFLRGRDMDAPPPQKNDACSVARCDLPGHAIGLCKFHYGRHKRGTPLDQPKRQRRGGISTSGYQLIMLDGRQVPEHRVIMERLLGRALAPHETVHHVNGIRHDNRPANLELWLCPQPKGQRAVDLAEWVVEFYPDLVAEALAQRALRSVS